MQIVAQLNNLRIAPRKVRLVAALIKGKDALVAQQQLNFLVRRSSSPLAKLLQSAMQNAENNFGLLKDNLFVKEIIVNEGVKLKRFRPKAMGQAALIQKKSSRIKIILEEKVPGLKANKQELAAKKKAFEVSAETAEHSKKHEKAKDRQSFDVRQDINKKGVFGEFKNIGRKLF